jgi:cob(I)alamin adenosyltransferase
VKIYTGTGDGGRTSLFSGERVRKVDRRVAAYGTVDELCSFVGAVAAQLPECEERPLLCRDLQDIQADLFVVGAILATSAGSNDAAMLPTLEEKQTLWLERKIDGMQAELDELHSFILPGGHAAATWSQVARAVCRRAEREIFSCEDVVDETCFTEIATYMNRLSDYFFVLARYLNKVAGVAEVTWRGSR